MSRDRQDRGSTAEHTSVQPADHARVQPRDGAPRDERFDAAAELLWTTARTDPLTGLRNRRACTDGVDEALAG
jgi:PleD family two-component response regulator